MSENKLFFLDSEDPELQRAFATFTDPIMENKLYGEVLQYMGTVIYANGSICHEFRHRALPDTNERRYWRISASINLENRINAGEFKTF